MIKILRGQPTRSDENQSGSKRPESMTESAVVRHRFLFGLGRSFGIGLFDGDA